MDSRRFGVSVIDESIMSIFPVFSAVSRPLNAMTSICNGRSSFFARASAMRTETPSGLPAESAISNGGVLSSIPTRSGAGPPVFSFPHPARQARAIAMKSRRVIPQTIVEGLIPTSAETWKGSRLQYVLRRPLRRRCHRIETHRRRGCVGSEHALFFMPGTP